MPRSKRSIASSALIKQPKIVTKKITTFTQLKRLPVQSAKKVIKYSQNDVTKFLRHYEASLRCWKAGLYIGSMVYFEMGDKLDANLIRGSSIKIGSSTLVLEADEWSITESGRQIADSDSVNDGIVGETILKQVKDKLLRSIKWQQITNECDIEFVPNFKVSLSGDDDEDLFSLTLPDGRIISCNAAYGFYSDGSLSEPHAAIVGR